jgi:MYXO-CTERM domain-containing protein
VNEPIQAESPNRVVVLASVAALAAVADLNASVAVQWSSAVGGNDHWYMCFRFANSTPWSVAQSIAQSWGGHLATITSAEENQFVYDVSISQNGWTFFDQWVGPYLGARKNSANQFEWVTGEAFTYASWLPGEPSSGLWEPNLMFLGGAPFTTNIGPYWNDVDDSQLSAVFEFSTAPLPAPGAIVLAGFAGLTSRRRRTP